METGRVATTKVVLFKEITAPNKTKKFGGYCVIAGSPCKGSGFTVTGPFESRNEAAAWARYSDEAWWIMPLYSPDGGEDA
jgi:hypothetical protein